MQANTTYTLFLLDLLADLVTDGSKRAPKVAIQVTTTMHELLQDQPSKRQLLLDTIEGHSERYGPSLEASLILAVNHFTPVDECTETS